jgi:hypothetical protein
VCLSPTNLGVNALNFHFLNLMAGPEITLFSADRSRPTSSTERSEEHMNGQDDPTLPPHRLVVKIGAPIVILRNLRSVGVANGQRGVIAP